MICPNCKTQNIEGAQFCRSCGTSLTGATKWWEQYGMVPVFFSNFRPSLLYVFCFVILLLPLIAISFFFSVIFFTSPNGQLEIFLCFCGSLLLHLILYLFAKKFIFVNNYRKRKKELLDTDFIEKEHSRQSCFTIVARGSDQSHLFGLFDVKSIKMQLPFEYTELKWTEKGKLLSATKDGQKFIIDINGNKYE